MIDAKRDEAPLMSALSQNDDDGVPIWLVQINDGDGPAVDNLLTLCLPSSSPRIQKTPRRGWFMESRYSMRRPVYLHGLRDRPTASPDI